MKKFIPENEQERNAILSLFIIHERNSVNKLAATVDDWILVGSMERRAVGVWEYDFNNPINCTMYSEYHTIRRSLTDAEVNRLTNEINNKFDTNKDNRNLGIAHDY